VTEPNGATLLAERRCVRQVQLRVTNSANMVGDAVGIYGVVASFAVARRTRAIGIRAALGAQRWSLIRLVVAEASATLAGDWRACIGTSGRRRPCGRRPLRLMLASPATVQWMTTLKP